MATYSLRVKVISRGKGGRITRSAAYRAGERLRDERTSEVYNYAHRNDIPHKEIILPSLFAGRPDMDWARDRATLWNAAEHAGKRRDARLGREVLVTLPHELGSKQRVELARRFAQELADRYGGAVDLAVHEPRPGADARHHHAHLLLTNREVTPNGLGSRTTLELAGWERHARGLCPSREELVHIRERWAQVANAALHAAGIDARIDHRSYKDRGIDREPKPQIPQKVHYAEKRTGEKTRAGEEIRTRYRERVEARRQGADALSRVIEKQREEHREKALRYFAKQAKSTSRDRRVARAQKVADLEEKAARQWLDYFEKQGRAHARPNTEQIAQKWLKFFADQDAVKTTHLKSPRLDDTIHSEQQVGSASTDQVDHHQRHGFRRGRPFEDGGRDADNDHVQDRDGNRGPGDRGPDGND